MDETNLDRRTEQIGRDIFARARRQGNDGVWIERAEPVKVQLLRFMDALATLVTPRQINEHVREYLQGVSDRLPWLVGRIIGGWPVDGLMGRCAAAIALKGTRWMARRFIAATDLPEISSSKTRYFSGVIPSSSSSTSIAFAASS